jgi:hypothetical protein
MSANVLILLILVASMVLFIWFCAMLTGALSTAPEWAVAMFFLYMLNRKN